MKKYKYALPMLLLLSAILLGGILIGGASQPGSLALAQTIGVKTIQPICSEQSILGRYGFISSGPAGPPTLGVDDKGPLAAVGTLTFFEGGQFTLATTRSVNGKIDPKPVILTGTYKVREECSLTLSFEVGSNFKAIIVEGGKEIRFIQTDSGTSFIMVAKRI
jgi:hypothetical protein